VVGGDGLAGDLGDLLAGGRFSWWVLVPAAEGGLDAAGADSGPAGRVEAGEDGAADAAGQVVVGAGDVAGGDDEVLGGVDGGLVAGPVGVGPGGRGLDGVGDGDAQCLVEGEQGPGFLFQAGRVARSQDPALEQGVPQREEGDLVLVG
jgi:hypothetical protein